MAALAISYSRYQQNICDTEYYSCLSVFNNYFAAFLCEKIPNRMGFLKPGTLEFNYAITKEQLRTLLKRSSGRSVLYACITLLYVGILTYYCLWFVKDKWLKFPGYLLSLTTTILVVFIARPSWMYLGVPIVVHKVMGNLVVLVVIVHLITVIVRAVSRGLEDYLAHKWEVVTTGMIAIICGLIIIIGSMKRYRRSSYRGFYIRHAICFIGFFVAVGIHLTQLAYFKWLHERPHYGSFIWSVAIPFVVAVLVLFITMMMRIKDKCSLEWRISLVEGYGPISCVELKPTRPMTKRFAAGSTGFIYIPGLDKVMSHPFSLDHTLNGSGIRCYVAQRGGEFTQRLVNSSKSCVGLRAHVEIPRQLSPNLSGSIPVVFIYGGAMGTYLYEIVSNRSKKIDVESRPLLVPQIKLIWCMGNSVQFLPILHVLKASSLNCSISLYYDREMNKDFKLMKSEFEVHSRKSVYSVDDHELRLSKDEPDMVKQLLEFSEHMKNERPNWTNVFTDLRKEFSKWSAVNVVLCGPNPFIGAVLAGKAEAFRHDNSGPEFCIFTEDQAY